MDISIIIPAYNEEHKIGNDVKAAGDFILKNNFSGEIIVVDDGGEDSTSEAARKVELSPGVELNVIRYEQHRGKGYAVRKGMLEAKGKYVLFADSGLCVPYDYVLAGLKLLESEGVDIAHGSRKLPDSIIIKKQPPFRRIVPLIFRGIFIHWLHIPSELTDTQCGFKIYERETARLLYDQCITEGFLFDVEVILRARKQDFKIREFPVEWKIDPDSRLSITGHAFGVLKELIALKRLAK
ncbi:MAG: glycosyltransferase [bacterium]|nr:glycosyltransferase [bacterium]